MRIVGYLLVLSILVMSCQTGRIPCPKVKTAKLVRAGSPKKIKPTASMVTAKVDIPEESQTQSKQSRTPEKFVKNVSVEEWDCPEPGKRKYLPRNVKQNIRKNARAIQQEKPSVASDTLALH